MLPICTDNGSRLAAILPSCLSSLAAGQGKSASAALSGALGIAETTLPSKLVTLLSEVPKTRSVVVVVVDGLGFANFQARASHARTLHELRPKRIETVTPSTTGAALTSLTTGRLPGEHGLVGYQIRHPEQGLISTLKGWDNVANPVEWQRETPLFAQATQLGARAVAIGRPAHASGGLTASILAGAEYLGAHTIAERFAIASQLVRSEAPVFAYLYVDELDKAAHAQGWESDAWVQRLELFDSALRSFVGSLPSDVGVVITADHGIVDVPAHKQVILDADPELCAGVAEIGGEPRMRSLYLDLPSNTDQSSSEYRTAVAEVAERFSVALGKRAWVSSRAAAIDAGWFGPIDHTVASRIGDVIIAARGQFAFTLLSDSSSAHSMVGQHGSISDEERGVPLAFAGRFAGSVLGSIISQAAMARNNGTFATK